MQGTLTSRRELVKPDIKERARDLLLLLRAKMTQKIPDLEAEEDQL